MNTERATVVTSARVGLRSFPGSVPTKTYCISDAPRGLRVEVSPRFRCWTWILFAELPVIESGFDKTDVSFIEVFKHITGNPPQKSIRVVDIDEARAEWRFYIAQGFQRITDPADKGWAYTARMMANYIGEINEDASATADAAYITI